jgi:hypothetical protein
MMGPEVPLRVVKEARRTERSQSASSGPWTTKTSLYVALSSFEVAPRHDDDRVNGHTDAQFSVEGPPERH